MIDKKGSKGTNGVLNSLGCGNPSSLRNFNKPRAKTIKYNNVDKLQN